MGPPRVHTSMGLPKHPIPRLMTNQRKKIVRELTGTEERLWTFILSYLSENDMVPSYDQICEELGYASVRSAWYWIRKLEAKGLIQSVPKEDFRGYKVKPI